MIAINVAYTGNLSLITKPFGFKGPDNSALAVIYMISGFTVAVIVGKLLDYFPRYKLINSMFCIFGAIAMILVMGALTTEK